MHRIRSTSRKCFPAPRSSAAHGRLGPSATAHTNLANEKNAGRVTSASRNHGPQLPGTERSIKRQNINKISLFRTNGTKLTGFRPSSREDTRCTADSLYANMRPLQPQVDAKVDGMRPHRVHRRSWTSSGTEDGGQKGHAAWLGYLGIWDQCSADCYLICYVRTCCLLER